MSWKRLRIVSCLVALAAVGLPALIPKILSEADDPKVATRSALEGTWHMVAGELDVCKFIIVNKYINTYVKGGVLVHAFGGKCGIEGNKYTETVEYRAPTAELGTVGASATFEWTITGDTLRIVGDIGDGKGGKLALDEKWQRAQ